MGNGASETRYYAGESATINNRNGKYRHIMALRIEKTSQKAPKRNPKPTQIALLCRRELHSEKSERQIACFSHILPTRAP